MDRGKQFCYNGSCSFRRFPRGGFCFYYNTGGTFMLEKIFHLKENHTDVKTELMASPVSEPTPESVSSAT